MPDTQMVTIDGVLHLIDVVSGSAATLTRGSEGWAVREGGPLRLWERVEEVIDAFMAAGRPVLETFTLRVDDDGQRLLHPLMSPLPLSQV